MGTTPTSRNADHNHRPVSGDDYGTRLDARRTRFDPGLDHRFESEYLSVSIDPRQTRHGRSHSAHFIDTEYQITTARIGERCHVASKLMLVLVGVAREVALEVHRALLLSTDS